MEKGDILIPVNISFEDYEINNIKFNELNDVLSCINQNYDNIKALGRSAPLDIEDIKQRYIETLINSMEFFCGIYYKKVLIGILKGRIEVKNLNELWLLSLILNKEYRQNGLGSKILKHVEEYFESSYSIEKLCAVIIEGNNDGQRFWKKNDYILNRITRGNNINEPGIVIMEKKNKNI